MEEALRRDIAALCQKVAARGWVANHDGNASARLQPGGDRYVASPTAVHKGDVRAEMAVVLDAEGKVIGGERKVFSEIALHLACYRARPDVGFVLHAHPPTATGWAVAGETFFDPPFLAEPVVTLGESIPLVPYVAPGGSTAELEGAIARCDAVLLGNHGVLTVGRDAEQAFLRMELVEHLARIALVARQVGGARPIPREDVEKLLAARAKAGLAPQAGAAAPWVPGSSAEGARPDVSSVVRDALKRLG
ncbi:MAG: class II aldolase/adducin family protein [Pseudomonadota bacterium]|nr:class II aldolase/adducin family protein [Pseudomonadota bacterium]